MVRIDPLKRIHTSSFNWNVSTPSNNIITILYNDPALLKAKYPILGDNFACNAYLTDLYTIERAYSLPSAQLPDYTDEDTRRERTLKTSRMQWGSAAFHANFFVTGKTPPISTNDWVFIGTIPILNTEGFKYTRHRPMDLVTHNLARPFGEGSSLGLQIENVGYPLTSADKLGIDCTWHQETSLVQDDWAPVLIQTAATVTSYSDSIIVSIGTLARQLFAARPTRDSLTITNNSTTATVYYSLNGGTPSASSNDGTLAPGITREIAKPTGIITAIATAANTQITAKETYKQ